MINQDDEDETSNSVGATRYPCMPSLVAMQQMRNRLNLAYLGKKLMKWSAMATGRELRRISHEIHGVYDDYSDDSRNGYIVLARARYFYPHLNSIVIENIPKEAQVTLTNTIKTVSGVRVTQYTIEDSEKDAYVHLGIERGGQVIKEAKTVWNNLIKRMIMILELRTSFILVEQANRSATKRFNVLGKLIIPKIHFTLKYIMAELEEKEREENFRLKRFKQLKVKRKDEEVQICRCCFSTFAAGEIIDGDMCGLCKRNIRVKGKIQRNIPHTQCIKDGRMQIERACHLNSQRIHFPYAEDNLKYVSYKENLQIKIEEILTDVEKVEIEIEDVGNKFLPSNEAVKNEEIPVLCNGTKKIHMYSYILGVLNSVYDETDDILQEKSSLHLRKLLRMPANLPYPYEGIDYLPRLLRMPKDIIPAYNETCTKCARGKNIKMPLDLGSYSIPCEECKSLLNKNEYKSPCEIKLCEKCRSMIHMPLDVPILSCPNCSSKSYLTMPLNIPINISPCQSVHKNCKNLSPFMSFISNRPPESSNLPYIVPREILVCHSWTPNIKKLLRIPRCLSLGNAQRESTNEPPNMLNCSCQPNSHSHYPQNEALNMYIHQLCQPQPNENPVRMPLNLTNENQLKDNNVIPEDAQNSAKCTLQSQIYAGYIKMPSDLGLDAARCEECASKSQPDTDRIKMPADLGSDSIPCTECKSLLNTNVYKTPCEMKNCEKCRSTIHLPLDLPILACSKCSSKLPITKPNLDKPETDRIKMPADLGSDSIPCTECKSLLNTNVNKTPCEMKNCEKCRSTIHLPLDLPILSCSKCSSKLPITKPNLDKPMPSELDSSYLPYAVPRETLICHSWTPKIRKLLHMPRNLSSTSTQSEPLNMSRCFCQPNMHSVFPQNEVLHMYIHGLCQPQHNENFIRMPLNLAIENPPCSHSGTVYITKQTSSCSPCIITSSDEEKLFHDCKIDVDHSCVSACSLCLKDSDYEKIVKVETKKKRRPDGKFREEKVITEKYVVKTLIKPPDVCSCSRSDEFEDVILGEWSCDHYKKDIENFDKPKSNESKTNKTDENKIKKVDEDKSNKTDGDKTYKIDEYKTDSALETEPNFCSNCKSKKVLGKKDGQNELNNIICRCNEERRNEAQTKCECYKFATSENDKNAKICTLKRLPDLVRCKNDGCLTENLLKLLTPCQLTNGNVASEYNATNPCHSIVIKSADNETIVCTRSNSKVRSKANLAISTAGKELDILQPSFKFSKSKETSSGVASSSLASPIKQLNISGCSNKWDHESSSAKESAQLNQESTITKIVQSYLNKNNHKTTSCTDLEIIRQVLNNSIEITKPSPDLCYKKNICLTKHCPFHSHSIAKSSSKHKIKCSDSETRLDNETQNLCNEPLESLRPVTPRNTEMNVAETSVSQKVDFEDEYLKIKQEIDKVIKLTTKKDTQTYYKTIGKVESSKSCCPIPSRLGMPITPTPIISIPKSPLASKIYPSKYNDDIKMKETGTQTKASICDKEVKPYETCSKTSSLSCHSAKSHPQSQELHNHSKRNTCAVCDKKSALLSYHDSKYKIENKHLETHHNNNHGHHQKHHQENYDHISEQHFSDKGVKPCETCSKTSSLSCHSAKSHPQSHELHNHSKRNTCAECDKKSALLSSHGTKNKIENKHLETHHNNNHGHHQNHHQENYDGHHHHHKSEHHHSEHHKIKEKYIIKIKVNESKKPLTENDDFYIEGEMEDGSNVVIMRRTKSNIIKCTKPNDIPETICQNCLAKLRGEKPPLTPKCNKCHQQTKKCKYCDLLADYSVSGDPSVNVASVDSGNRCLQTSTISDKSSFISSVSMPGEEVCTKFSTSPCQSNKIHFSPCSFRPSRAELKSCEQASKIRGYASDCTIQKPLKYGSSPPPRSCKSVNIICPRTSDASTSTKVVNRYDVRSICDEPRSRRRSRCTPKASTARCSSKPSQYPMKSDTALNKRKQRTRPMRTRSFYESDCKYFKPPCCGCPF